MVAISVLLVACGQAATRIRLEPERPLVVRVGDVAVVELPSAARYSLGYAVNALKLESREDRNGVTIYSYRAVSVGNDTIVATPAQPGPGGCISCVTVHYFVTVE